MHVSVQTSRPPSRRRATRSLDILVVAADAEVRSIIERAMAGADSDGRFSVTVLDSARVAVARAEQKVDVIIVDGRLRVPGGQVLLQCLGDACPSALRVAVVPKASSELGVRLAKIAHQVLEGPMNGDRWYALIHAAGEMRAVLAHPRVADAVGSALVLPSPPHTYTQLTHLLNGPGGSFHRVTEIVERDTGLSAKLLQMVSSSFFGLPKAVQSVGGAVAYLGVDTVKTLVLSVEVTSMFRPSPSLCGFDIQRQQHAALVTSRLARSLMPPSEQADFAQLAGALCSVGDLLLADRAPALYRDAFFHSERKQIALHHAQRQHFGVAGSEVGACLLGMWGLPRTLCASIRHQHRPLEATGSTQLLASAVHVASRLAHDPETPLDTETRALTWSISHSALKCAGWERKLPELRESARQAVSS